MTTTPGCKSLPLATRNMYWNTCDLQYQTLKTELYWSTWSVPGMGKDLTVSGTATFDTRGVLISAGKML